jgi:hypothetical protein
MAHKTIGYENISYDFYGYNNESVSYTISNDGVVYTYYYYLDKIIT